VQRVCCRVHSAIRSNFPGIQSLVETVLTVWLVLDRRGAPNLLHWQKRPRWRNSMMSGSKCWLELGKASSLDLASRATDLMNTLFRGRSCSADFHGWQLLEHRCKLKVPIKRNFGSARIDVSSHIVKLCLT
jgi:hypothetical protein